MSDLIFHNTLGGAREPFRPANPDHVTIYVCGPTVYDYAHLGNARPAVVFDVLVRLLRRRFARVSYARNITDIDDKINARAAAQGAPIDAITTRFAAAYAEDMAAIGCAAPDIAPKVTEHVPEIIDFVLRLIARGHAYEAEGHVLFHVPSFADYGRLSGRSVEDMIAGARVEVAPFKRHPADFVLWKPSPTPDLPGWDSPWGRGRPGWHIECSAMIEAHLGHTIDIHGGGADLIFPHHENEIAQGTAAHDGACYAGMWMHNGMVTVEGHKMAKSAGNMLTVRDALARYPGEALRLVLLSAHYRAPVDWSDRAAKRAIATLDRLYALFESAGDLGTIAPDAAALAEVEAALADDLAFPRALAAIARIASTIRKEPDGPRKPALLSALREAGAMLGLLQAPEQWRADRARLTASDAPVDEARINALIAARKAAREQRDWQAADAIRADLAAMGIAIKDTGDTTQWTRA
ncbi:MAG: cysteine--tRNA ligase [Erythrobacter sp. SCN 62-14]|nr:MAG: cysteine--tRNA ligase [Erythrobacter sp. SCN 62-14]